MYGRIVRCVLSGSFRRDHEGLERVYRELITNGCQVLSPHRLAFIEQNADFVRDKTEADIDVRTLQDHHLLSISQADFVWLHVVNGYVGLSAAMEVGYANALKIPVFANDKPDDVTISQYVNTQPSVFAAIESLEIQGE
jgi:nucleoside 2-deoxyribosyltransferase